MSCVKGGGGNRCNPYEGDTRCINKRPILCINKSHIPRYPYEVSPCSSCAYANFPAFYEGWSEGMIGLTKPIRGCFL